MTKRVMKNFSELEEEALRAFVFTNPHGTIGFVYPQELVAGEELSPLMSAYSRTHVPFQDRVLEFLDQEKAEETRALVPHIIGTEGLPGLVAILRNPDRTLRVSRKTTDFNKKWVLKHGHDSIKEETQLFGHEENVSDITGKKTTGHPLNHPQVKSTRYLDFEEVRHLFSEDEDIQALPNADRVIEHIDRMGERYVETTNRLAELVYEHPENQKILTHLRSPEVVQAEAMRRLEARAEKDPEYVITAEEIEAERANILGKLERGVVTEEMRKSVLDHSRSYLLAVTKTSLGFSADARTTEEIITELLSSQRAEDRRVGQELWGEGRKVSPVLLGEKSHIRVDPWKVQLEKEFREYVRERFGDIEFKKGNGNGMKLLTNRDIPEMYTDKFNAALAIYPYLDASITDIMDNLEGSDVPEILRKAHEGRGEFDILHPGITHGGLMVEFLMGYHGYRDIFRHRRGPRSVQLLTTRLGFETPQLLEALGMGEEFREAMRESAGVYEETARLAGPHVAEKLVPFGALCRSLYSWQPTQIGYVGRLRSDIRKGNRTYVEVARDMVKQFREQMPETGQYLRVGEGEYPVEIYKSWYTKYDELKETEKGSEGNED